MSALSPSPSTDSRSGAGALMAIALSVTIAAVLALRAVSRATLSWRIISTTPSADFATAVAWPDSTARAAASASVASDLALLAARADRRG